MSTKINLDIIRGSRYLKSFIYQTSAKIPIDLSSYQARMDIRARYASSTPELQLTTENDMLVLNTTTGQVDIILNALDTEAISIDTGVFDLEIYNPSDTEIVDTILEGTVTIRDAITR